MSQMARVEKQTEICDPRLHETIFNVLRSAGFKEGETEMSKNGKFQIIHFESCTMTAKCPHCGQASDKVKAVASHTIQTAPSGNIPTYVSISKKRFKCLNTECEYDSFTEPITGIMPYMERSAALDAAILLLAASSSYREIPQTLKSLGYVVASNTIKAICNRITILDNPDVTKIGIDDVSLRKGHRFCTVIYDLETGVMLKIIRGRANDEIRDWLKAHSKIEVIARDRLSAYGKLIEETMPNCELIEVADRFHLIENLFSYLKKLLQEQTSMKITIANGVIKTKDGKEIKIEAGTDVTKGKHEFHCKNILCHVTTRDPKKKDTTRYKDLEKLMPLLEQTFPIIPTLRDIYSEYYNVIMGNDPCKFDEFISKYENDPEMKTFCELQKKDTAPIKNAISSGYSSGLVEGKNNKFKVLKRIIYGRACLVNLEKRCYLYFLKPKDRIALVVASLMA